MNTDQILNRYTLDEMLELLPAEIVRGKKHWYMSDELFDLIILKDKALFIWTVRYFNRRSGQYCYQVLSNKIKRAVAEMLCKLNEDKFITL